jgi:membrane protein
MQGQKHYNPFGAFFKLLNRALIEISKNDPLRLAGATAFFTTFSLPPILLILLQALGLFYTTEEARQHLFAQLSTYVGKETITQITKTLNAFYKLSYNNYVLFFGLLFLLFVATTLFSVIKSSLNQVWKIKVIHRSKGGEVLQDRLKAMLVIIVAGVLFLIGLFAEGLQIFIGRQLFSDSPLLYLYFNRVFSHVFSVLIVTAWFAVVFRYLPDAKAGGKIVLIGALLTGILFTIGKVILRWLLHHSNIKTLYGTSASIVLLMLFVFYASLILYYGAAFTKVLSVQQKHPIEPLRYASHYQLITDEPSTASNET